jgi:ferredoxin-like protein FixX
MGMKILIDAEKFLALSSAPADLSPNKYYSVIEKKPISFSYGSCSQCGSTIIHYTILDNNGKKIELPAMFVIGEEQEHSL